MVNSKSSRVLKLVSFFNLSIIAILITACTTSTPLTLNNSQKLHTISINPQITLPENEWFYTDGAQWGGAFGLAGLLIDSSITKSDENILDMVQQKAHISLQAIIKQEITDQINDSEKYQVITNSKYADAVMNVKVLMYGFTAPKLGFSNNLVPMLSI